MVEKKILISVVIPIKNGEQWLEGTLSAITKQSLFHQVEIIALDSGSTDNTIAILEKYGVNIHSVSPETFNHGLTRNYALQFCKGEFIVMTVQDAQAADENWLQALLDGFNDSDHVAGVCGQQVVPHDFDKNPVSWFRPYSEPKINSYQFDTLNDFEKLSPEEKKNICSWDNVTAMYRHSVLKEIPFRKTPYGEDAIWAQEALKAGYALVYNQAAKVYHYHQEDWNFTFKRALTTMYLRYKQFGYLYPEPKQNLRDQLSIIKTIWRSHPLKVKSNINWIVYNNNQYKAAKEAHKIFTQALAKSEEELDAVHVKYCGIPPSPVSKRASLVN